MHPHKESINIFLLIVIIIIGIPIYFLPSIIARKKRGFLYIFICNLLFAGTGIG
jgi:hypothetical protein